MSMRRFTRPTNAFSKKADNHNHAVALYKGASDAEGNSGDGASLTNHAWKAAELVSLLN